MYVIVTLSSVTSAKRVERALSEIGILCRTMHTPKIISQYGCSHSVRVKKSEKDAVLSLCKTIGVQVRGVYLEKQDKKGRTEYEKIR